MRNGAIDADKITFLKSDYCSLPRWPMRVLELHSVPMYASLTIVLPLSLQVFTCQSQCEVYTYIAIIHACQSLHIIGVAGNDYFQAHSIPLGLTIPLC